RPLEQHRQAIAVGVGEERAFDARRHVVGNGRGKRVVQCAEHGKALCSGERRDGAAYAAPSGHSAGCSAPPEGAVRARPGTSTAQMNISAAMTTTTPESRRIQ